MTPNYAEIAARLCAALADTSIFRPGHPRELEKMVPVRGLSCSRAMCVSETLEQIIRDALVVRFIVDLLFGCAVC